MTMTMTMTPIMTAKKRQVVWRNAVWRQLTYAVTSSTWPTHCGTYCSPLAQALDAEG